MIKLSCLLDCLRDKLNEKFLTDLSPICWTLDEQDEEAAPCNDKNCYIFIGASHAGRMAEALEKLGHTVVDLSEPGWRPSEFNVETVCNTLRDCRETPHRRGV
jgi:hypothetical protein